MTLKFDRPAMDALLQRWFPPPKLAVNRAVERLSLDFAALRK